MTHLFIKEPRMPRMVVRLGRVVKLRLRRVHRRTRDKGLAQRCWIVLLRDKRLSRSAIAEAVGCSVSWVDRVLRRFDQGGVAALEDRRQDNGDAKLDEHYLATLIEVVGKRPVDFGFHRPTWTRELLVKVMARITGVTIHVGTMSRALQRIGARRGRPRPTVGCPWPKRAKNKRIRMIRRLLEDLPPDQAAVWLDEVDVHLNPKIGLDWMNRGQQKTVLTPGQNQKRYLAGAMDSRTRRLTWVEGERKNSGLFIDLLHALVAAYPKAKVIHVVLDNYRIHHSRIAQAAIASLGGRVVLHFLPPYCPQENRIERLWQDLHANVTRNHTRRRMQDLMSDVRRYLHARNAAVATHATRAAA